MVATTISAPIATPARSRGANGGTYNFRKQPIRPISDAEVVSSDDQKPRPVSLLSSMLSDHASPPRLEFIGGGRSGSSTPSTTVASPKANDTHDPVSILRRSSIGSDAEPFHLPLARVTSAVLKDQVPPPNAHRPGALKFAVATHRPDTERHVVPLPVDDSEGDDGMTDAGYEEDSEGGSPDDEPSFMFHAHRLAMEQGRGRPTSCLIKDRPASTSPNAKRGPQRTSRDHVRVDPSAGHDSNRCSRHQSPPPSTHSDSHSRYARPGPREGRAGSPIPSPLPEDEDDEDEDEDDNGDEDEMGANDSSQDGTRHETAGYSPDADIAIEDDDDDSSDPSAPTHRPVHSPATVAVSLGNGVRSILRRASEHLPGFRPSFSAVTPDASDVAAPDGDVVLAAQPVLGRAKSLGSRPNRQAEALFATEDAPALAPSRPIACPKPRSDQLGL